MKLTYYPGCTLKTKAAELDRYARVCAEKLGVTMEEIEAWQCCGGVFSTARDEIASKLSAVRALRYANERGQTLVTVCSACHNVLKQTNHAMQTDAEFADHVNRRTGDFAAVERIGKCRFIDDWSSCRIYYNCVALHFGDEVVINKTLWFIGQRTVE